jgi:hypothetical protein
MDGRPRCRPARRKQDRQDIRFELVYLVDDRWVCSISHIRRKELRHTGDRGESSSPINWRKVGFAVEGGGAEAFETLIRCYLAEYRIY